MTALARMKTLTNAGTAGNPEAPQVTPYSIRSTVKG